MTKMASYRPYQPKLMHSVIRYCYSFILCLLLPIALLKLMKRADKSKGEGNKNRERFGFLRKPKQGGILIHCVSMGEVNAAKKLVDGLKTQFPELSITISTTSATGAKHARALFGDFVQHCYLAVDIPVFIRLFFNRLQPKLVIVTEVEIWPNMLHQCYKRDIQAILVNGRMSEQSVANYQRLSWLFRPALRKFSLICPQGPQDFERFLTLGVYKANLSLTNNMKFDLQIESKDKDVANLIAEQIQLDNAPVFVAGSTHEGEEAICAETFKKLKQKHKSLVMILVPRHPHRFDKVAQFCNASGLRTLRVSELELDVPADEHKPHYERPDVLVVDAMGLLKACFALGTVGFIGGSFAPKGGHNPLEPALYGVPVAMGPSMYNNPVICESLIKSGGLRKLQQKQELTDVLANWLENIELRTADGKAAQAVLAENAGAVNRTLECVSNVLNKARG